MRQKRYVGAVAYGVLSASFALYTLLDTFAIPKTYAQVLSPVPALRRRRRGAQDDCGGVEKAGDTLREKKEPRPRPEPGARRVTAAGGGGLGGPPCSG